jgi:hypothetical protein
MAKSSAERAKAYRARRGATTRGELASCGTLAAWNRHVRLRAKLRRQGVPEADLPPIDDACRDAARDHQAVMRTARAARQQRPVARELTPTPIEPAPVEVSPAVPSSPVVTSSLKRRQDPRTAATFYVWVCGPVLLEVRRRRFPDGRLRWELFALPGSVVPGEAEWADPTGDSWSRLGDLRLDLDRFARAVARVGECGPDHID